MKKRSLAQKEIKTFFAPGFRLSRKEIIEQISSIKKNKIIDIVLSSLDGYVLILNSHRQILAANEEILEALDIKENDKITGKRPGEAFGCIHSKTAPSGCGTSEHCKYCGAVITILAAQNRNKAASGECCLTTKNNGKLEVYEFHVKATPLQVKYNNFLIFTLQDITSSKRKDIFERIFYHDLKNIMSAIYGWSYLLDSKPKKASENIVRLVDEISDHIDEQIIIREGEKDRLKLNIKEIVLKDFVDEKKKIFIAHETSRNKNLNIKEKNLNLTIKTDKRLLTRILVNMIKNAFEAIKENMTVTFWVVKQENNILFNVHNKGQIPKNIGLRLFKRNFTTKKSLGHGLGTYSMKLLGESYLNGKVYFNTSYEKGTIFTFKLPVDNK